MNKSTAIRVLLVFLFVYVNISTITCSEFYIKAKRENKNIFLNQIVG